MRTRSEWFLGDAGCGDEDGEHDDATCECRAKAAAAAAAAILEMHDEMDCGNHHLHNHPVPMGSCKRPVTQLFETTSGFGIPESERERNGGGGGDSEHFTSNMFGTLPSINAFVASSTTNTFTCCDVANGNDYSKSGVNNRTKVNGRRRKEERSMHSFHHARIEEEEDNAGGPDCPSSSCIGGDDWHCFNLIADTHNAPSFSAPVQTSSPYAVRKELRRGDAPSFDGNNNTVKATDQIDSSRTVVERKRLGSLHDEKFDEIMVFSTATASPLPSDGRASGSGPVCRNNRVQNHVHGKHKTFQRPSVSKPRPQQGRRMPYLSMSHEDLSMPIMDRHKGYNKSSRSSGSLNRSQKSNDDKLMVLFKILDFIF